MNFTPEILLTIELVPETCWFSNLRSELSKKDWDCLRQLTYRAAKYRCQICGGKGSKWPVECHEIWEYDDQHHIQRLAGLVALCPACHEVKHMGLAGLNGRHDQALRHLAKINQWSLVKAQRYVDEVFQVWSERSRYEWHLDLSYLDQFNLLPQTDHHDLVVLKERRALSQKSFADNRMIKSKYLWWLGALSGIIFLLAYYLFFYHHYHVGDCAIYKETIMVDGEPKTEIGTACLKADGHWHMQLDDDVDDGGDGAYVE